MKYYIAFFTDILDSVHHQSFFLIRISDFTWPTEGTANSEIVTLGSLM